MALTRLRSLCVQNFPNFFYIFGRRSCGSDVAALSTFYPNTTTLRIRLPIVKFLRHRRDSIVTGTIRAVRNCRDKMMIRYVFTCITNNILKRNLNERLSSCVVKI
ncbi:unnamed protein product [Tenebrio molitor]|nr:unnamed protein product [Tenebrio molitor]